MSRSAFDPIILLDFGASRVKGVVWSCEERVVVASCERPSVVLSRGIDGSVEGDPESYWAIFEEVVRSLRCASPSAVDIWICSEMHGFLLADSQTREPLTRYVSWQDERANFLFSDYSSEAINIFSDRLLEQTGLKLRHGLPVVGLKAKLMTADATKPPLFLNLVEWLIVRGGSLTVRSHPTLAAGSGMLSLSEFSLDRKLLQLVQVDAEQFIVPPLQDEGAPIGEIVVDSTQLRLWGGVGDLQAAIFGMGFPNVATVFINIGTGSQVGVARESPVTTEERRLLVDGGIANVITHIPSGRALNLYAELIDGCCAAGGGRPIFWSTFCSLSADEVLSSTLTCELATFESAWRFSTGGAIHGIREGHVSHRALIASVARSWLEQYAIAVSQLCVGSAPDSFVLGGGLSRRATFIRQVLEHLTAMRCITKIFETGEETLDGLLALATQVRSRLTNVPGVASRC